MRYKGGNGIDPQYWMDNALSIVFYAYIFILYVFSFHSLYKGTLELIGFILFFAMHIVMMIGMLRQIFKGPESGVSTPDVSIISITQNLLPDWSGLISVKWSIIGGLILLFVALLIFVITIARIRTVHVKTGGYEKSGLDFFFQDVWSDDKIGLKNKFKPIAITTTVLLWVQYLLYMNYDMVKSIIPNILGYDIYNILNAIFITFGTTILALSSTAVWISNNLMEYSKTISDPSPSQITRSARLKRRMQATSK